MPSYEEIIIKDGRDPKFYIPVIGLFEKNKKPLSIKQVAQLMSISYSAAKPRLHKLAKLQILQGMKRGYYCLASEFKDYSTMLKPQGKLVFLNACVRVMGSSNGVSITVYNSRFGEITKNQYCRIEAVEKNKFILRKSNEFYGSKLQLLISKSAAVSISRRLLPEDIVFELSSKVIPVKVGIYLDDWDLTLKELFSTESKEEGELAEELDKLGEIDKKNKFEDLKADIIFIKDNLKIPIEITNTNPFSSSNFKNSRKSGVKSAFILERLYFFIRWNIIHQSPTVLVINKDWENLNWLKTEIEFMKKFKCHVLFTDFQSNWAKKVAHEINLLTV